jgi:uncharacterized caspase-like protein
MQAMPIRIFLVLFILILIYPSALQAAMEQRIALVIGNSAYSSSPLKNPVNDATDTADALQKLGFMVILKKNANLETMEEAIEDFGNRLKRGGVGLFYYAGHGVQVNGVNYLIPIGAKINRETDVKYHSVDANKILDEMGNANNGLNIVLLDACRDNPYARKFRSATRGLAIVSSAPVGTFISYSTAPGQVARDGEGRNSPYTKALLQYVKEPGLTIEDVFKGVRQKLRKETGQVPWELSSLEGKFFFVSGEASKTAEVVKEATATPAVELDPQRMEIESERERLQKQRDLLEQKEALAKEKEELAERERKLAIGERPSASVHQREQLDKDELRLKQAEIEFKAEGHLLNPDNREEMRRRLEAMRNKLEKDKKQLAVVEKRPFVPAANDLRKDGRFIAYDNGTVLDTSTNLMWATKDNGSDINWVNAVRYCETYRGGGYTDWRMPTKDELVGLYNSKTELIKLTDSWVWAFDRGYKDLTLQFKSGGRLSSMKRGAVDGRAFPVRSSKLLETENSGKVYFGIFAKDTTMQEGVEIIKVQSGSQADYVRLQPHDIIRQVNLTKISSMQDYTREIEKVAESKKIMLLIKRGERNFFINLIVR